MTAIGAQPAFVAPASSLEFVQFDCRRVLRGLAGRPRLPAGPLEGTRATSRPAGKPPIAVIAPRAPSA